MKENTKYYLLTFYKFVNVENPKGEVRKHSKFCSGIGIKGRIYIGVEGISATMTCNEGQMEAYKLYLDNHELFNNPSDFDIKKTQVDGHKFSKMIVKEKEEIVTLGKKYTKEEIEDAGNRLSIKDFKDLIDNGNIDDYIILDMRNNHEYKLGHFKNAIPANTMNFRELNEQIEDYKKQFGDKKIISYCTGGIRCEKSTVMMQEAGLKNTYQLDGGVVKYINTYNDGNWLGNLYVFDDRVSCEIGDKDTHTTIGECVYSSKKTDNCENCRYSPCNARIIATKKEYKKHFGFCSLECSQKALKDILVKNSDFDSMNYKLKRIESKNNPELKNEIINVVSKHLESNLEGVFFNNEFSIKEDLIID